jgi:DNA helicase IV
MQPLPMLFDPLRFPNCSKGLRVAHKFGGDGTVVAFALSISETTVVPVIWDQLGRHPSRVPASSLTAFGQTPFAELYWLFSQRAAVFCDVCNLLKGGSIEEAKLKYATECVDWWESGDFAEKTLRATEDLAVRVAAARELERVRIAERERAKEKERAEQQQRQQVKDRARVEFLLRAGEIDRADALYFERCTNFWPQESYSNLRASCEAEARKREEARKFELQERERANLRDSIRIYLQNLDLGRADNLYELQCRTWWESDEYLAERARFVAVWELAEAIPSESLRRIAEIHHRSKEIISTEDIALLVHDKIIARLARAAITLDRDQVTACAQPARARLIRARAGSGKTRTLSALAALLIDDEKLSSDQVLILAFNKTAADEIGERVRSAAGVPEYRNARTFHSLAHRLAGNTGRKLVFDDGNLQPSRREQSRYVEQVIHKIVNPAFRTAFYEFFRRELEQIDQIGSSLPRLEYFAFRRAMTQFTLGGENVKSNGEKYIADFLFEHGVSYVYEKVYSWEGKDRLQGSPYRPDFCINAGGKDVILEHWAFDPNDPVAQVPTWWKGTTTKEYREQIADKRQFWKASGITLLETHTAMLANGRAAFEGELKQRLVSAGIYLQKLGQEELERRVAEAPRTISAMAKLFLNFISRAKKKGWSVEEAARRIADKPDSEPRNRIFHDLALRAFGEYETALRGASAMDFDDLLVSATKSVRDHGARAVLRLDRNDAIPLGQIRWILVDEFQDFSELYFRLIEAVLEVNSEVGIVAVGDDWQAINGFAGAQLSFFNNFTHHFTGAATSVVPTNYRSGRLIVGAGNKIMDGHGPPAISSKASRGEVEICYVDKVVLSDRVEDALCLEVTRDGVSRKPIYQAAKALKACADFIAGSVFVHAGERWLRDVLVMSRTGFAYGLALDAFKKCLEQVVGEHLDMKELGNEIHIEVKTAHSSKGKEADTVIVLEATARQFPKIHADNQLYAPFGVSIVDTLAEERRLFYVAITRAEHRLMLLTESGQESPFVGEIQGYLSTGQLSQSAVADASAPSALGPLAQAIEQRVKSQGRMHLLRNNITPAAVPVLDQIISEGMGEPELAYFLSSDVCAELAWPSAKPPMAVLTGYQCAQSKEWIDAGWVVHEVSAPLIAR